MRLWSPLIAGRKSVPGLMVASSGAGIETCCGVLVWPFRIRPPVVSYSSLDGKQWATLFITSDRKKRKTKKINNYTMQHKYNTTQEKRRKTMNPCIHECFHGRKSRGERGGRVPHRIWSAGDASANRPPPEFVMFQNSKHQLLTYNAV